jgi:dual-specificity kinase
MPGHYCLVFERLGMSLYDYLKAHDFSPYPVGHVRDFARQLLESLAFLRSINLIHTDLKPENILLCSDEMIKVGGSDVEVPASTAVKGESVETDTHHDIM